MKSLSQKENNDIFHSKENKLHACHPKVCYLINLFNIPVVVRRVFVVYSLSPPTYQTFLTKISVLQKQYR